MYKKFLVIIGLYLMFTSFVFADNSVKTKSVSLIDIESVRLGGMVTGDDLDYVWFAFSKKRQPYCPNILQKEQTDDSSDSRDSFYVDVYDLQYNTRYYYRACGKKGRDIVSGSIKSFYTKNRDSDDSYGDIYTNSPVSQSYNSVKLRGKVSNENDVNVWFSISDSDKTPECTDNSEIESVSGTYDNGDYFYKSLNDLSANTKYYYKACGESGDGDIISGSIKNFKTENGVTIFKVLTNDASNISQNSAQLNGEVFMGDYNNLNVYFVYGSAKNNLSARTTRLLVKSNLKFQAVQELESGSKYYYQVIVESLSGEVLERGGIKMFATEPEVLPQTDKKVLYNNLGLTIEKKVSLEKIYGYNDRVVAEFNDDIFYKIRVFNKSDKIIKNIEVTETIPKGLIDENENNINNYDKLITWKIDELEVGQAKIFVSSLKVSDKVEVGDEIISNSEVRLGNKTKKTNSVFIEIVENNPKGSQSANIFGTNTDFLPKTFIGLLSLMLFLVLIGYLIKKLFESDKLAKKEVFELSVSEIEKMEK